MDTSFKREGDSFLTIFIGKLFERSPLSLTIARYASSLSPATMKEKPDLYCNRFKNLLLQLNEPKKLNTKECDVNFKFYFRTVFHRTPVNLS